MHPYSYYFPYSDLYAHPFTHQVVLHCIVVGEIFREQKQKIQGWNNMEFPKDFDNNFCGLIFLFPATHYVIDTSKANATTKGLLTTQALF